MTDQSHKRFCSVCKGPQTCRHGVRMTIFEKTFKTGRWLARGITVEPIFFLYNLNFATYYIIFQNLQIEKACRVNLNQTEIVCANLKDPANQNVQVTALKVVIDILKTKQPCFRTMCRNWWQRWTWSHLKISKIIICVAKNSLGLIYTTLTYFHSS